jgi:tetraacyldisaccharide 4'-kinase
MRRAWERSASPALVPWLATLAAGYRGVLGVRERLYDWGALPSRRLPCPVISIGNLTVGGTGKTPAVELAVLTLRQLGALPGVVSRGYGRRSSGVQVVADQKGLRADARWAGDEPYLLARRLPGVPVVVGANRYQAGRRCLESFGVRALVLDDAFQHRTLQKDLEVVLVLGDSPWGNGHLFPRGPLREPLSALARAHVLVVVGGDGEGRARVAEALGRHNREASIVLADYQPVECWRAGHPTLCPPEALHGRRLLAFAGIGRPEGFRRTAERLGVSLVGFVEFPDHHWYTAEDLATVAADARRAGAEGLVTTEKDSVRLPVEAAGSLPVWVLSVRLGITDGGLRWRDAFARVLRT